MDDAPSNDGSLPVIDVTRSSSSLDIVFAYSISPFIRMDTRVKFSIVVRFKYSKDGNKLWKWSRDFALCNFEGEGGDENEFVVE